MKSFLILLALTVGNVIPVAGGLAISGLVQTETGRICVGGSLGGWTCITLPNKAGTSTNMDLPDTIVGLPISGRKDEILATERRCTEIATAIMTGSPVPTPSPIPSPTPTPIPSPTPRPSPSPTPLPSPSPTPSPSPSPTPQPSPSPVPSNILLTDNFNDNIRDPKWVLGTVAPGFLDLNVPVAEVSQRLEVSLLTLAGLHYNGYISTGVFSLVNGSSVRAELVQRPLANTYVTAGLHVGNGAANYVTLYYSNNRLNLYNARTFAGVSTTYDPVAHRFIRLRYNSTVDAFKGDTSPDGLVWTERISLPRGGISLTGVKVSIGAGTQQSVSSPGKAIFDNFEFVR